MTPRTRILILPVLCVALAAVLPAAASAAVDPERIEDRLGPGVSVDLSEDTGRVSFVGASRGNAIEVEGGESPVAAARSFLTGMPGNFGVSPANADLAVAGVGPGPSGGTSVRLQQQIDGVPVIGGEFVVNLTASGDVLSVGGEAEPAQGLSTDPAIGATEAIDAAFATVSKGYGLAVGGLEASQPQLSVFDSRILGGPGLERPTLVWRLEVTAENRDDIRELVLVDAQAGNVALNFSQVHEALDRRICDAGNSQSQLPCLSPVRIEGGAATGVADVNKAYDFSGETYDFFFSRFGRDSVDDAGLPMQATVRFCEGGCPYDNAFWNGSQTVFGPGWAEDDVTGHEWSHAVTEFSSNLFYYYQSGAINESMSDVFGEMIDQLNSSGNDTAAAKWKIGEDVGAIRDMEDPPANNDPDRITSPNYTADLNETDGGGVHTNSGVNNKAAFLITDGATFNGQTVTGLGITKAARIYYTVETSFLTSSSDYGDLANFLPQACTSVIGTDGITAADCTEVSEAVLATEMATNPSNAAIPASAAICDSGTPAYSLFDDLETPGSGNWSTQVISGGNSWFYPQNPNPILGDFKYGTSGDTHFWGYDRSTTSSYAIRMNTDVAALPANSFLRFDHAYGFEDQPSNFDGGIVEYSTNGGGVWNNLGPLITSGGYNGTLVAANPLGAIPAYVKESHGYYASRADLNSLAGQNVRFRFRIGTDVGGDDYGWFIDDIRVYTCGPPPPQQQLTVNKTGAGDGTVTSNPAGITCDPTCASNFNENSVVTLTATPDGTSSFTGWSGEGCSGTGTCVVTMDAAKLVDADFAAIPQRTLTVSKGGAGGGTVTGTGISCGADCDQAYNDGTGVTLTATPSTGSTFTGWSGSGCSGTGACNLTMDADKAVTATFALLPPPRNLQVSLAGSGTGGVVSSPGGISCSPNCSADYPDGQSVTLSAVPTGGSEFAGWAGAGCSGTGTCTIAMNANEAVTATFNQPGQVLPLQTKITRAKIKKDARRAKFRFTGSGGEGALRFQCKLDRKPFSSCGSPREYRNLAPGKHTFRVRVRDASGVVDLTAAKRTFRIPKPE